MGKKFIKTTKQNWCVINTCRLIKVKLKIRGRTSVNILYSVAYSQADHSLSKYSEVY